jgi:polysaccharide chain length determinant protein (PEP-CTERM system associated)
MINTGKSFNINDYIEIILRRIWYIIIPFVVVLIITGLYAYFTPKEYRVSTLILVTPQKVPVDYVRPTVTSTIEDRLQSIGQDILSRTRLERIIAEFKLYAEEAKSLTLEEIVELLRKNIRVEIRGREGYFTISYIGKDPKVVTMVTNKLASLFIEENLKLRELQAQGTTEFLAIELNATKAKLDEQEGAITNFKKRFMAELPDQRDSNLRILAQLQLDHQRISDSLRAAQDRKVVIQKQLSGLEFMIEPSSEEQSLSSPKLKIKDPYELELEKLKKYFTELQLKYTEKHPDFLITKKRIDELEKRIEASKGKAEDMNVEKGEEKEISSSQIARSRPKASKKGIDEGKRGSESGLFYKEIESQLGATDIEIKRLMEEGSRAKAKIAEYQARVENAPVRELGMAQLTRDQQNTMTNYQNLLRKSQEAQQAENLERRQKGEQFKVIDPARIPEKPFKPDIPKILLLGLLLGMGFGFGVAFFREQMDHSFRDAEDLEVTLGFKVLANIPKVEKKAA